MVSTEVGVAVALTKVIEAVVAVAEDSNPEDLLEAKKKPLNLKVNTISTKPMKNSKKC